ncbi:MAG: hypothetical protein U1F65_00740 [Verrucomicrobiota bacterium]
MSANNWKTGRPGWIWLALVLAGIAVAEAGSAYLPVTGPTPLRFEVAMVKPAMNPALLTQNRAPEAPAVPSPTATNAVAETPVEVRVSASAPPVIEPPAPYTIRPAADNLLIITPQMLGEYFKPVASGTNNSGAGVFVPVPFNFLPPTEKPVRSSRATYKVE